MRTTHKILLSLVASAVAGVSQAGQQLLTFTPLTGANVTIYANQTAQQVIYQVQNKSTKTHTLEMAAIPAGFTRITSGQGVCQSPFVLKGGRLVD